MEKIVDAIDANRLQDARALIIEYQQALGVSLCFQDFDVEIDGLDSFYGLPGRLYIAVNDEDDAVACVGYHPIRPHNTNQASDANAKDDPAPADADRWDTVEIKRLYVKPASRTSGLGRILIQTVIDDARRQGFRSICLDTLPQLEAAIHLYQQFGFTDIEPYCENPLPGVRWMAMQL